MPEEEVQQLQMLKASQFWQMLLPEQQQILMGILRNIDIQKMTGGMLQ